MLQVIREKFTGGFAIAILALIGVPFLFFGINYDFIGTSFAAKVNGEDITSGQLESSYQQQLQQNPQLAQLPDEYRAQFRQSVLDSLVRQRLIDQYLVDAGYRISDEQVTAAVQRIPDFHVNGVFDKDTYLSLLAQNGYDPTQFEESQRNGMRQDQLQRAVGSTAIVTPAEYRRYLNLVAEQRLVSLATFTTDGVAEDFEVAAEQVATFYDDNPTLFLTSETADIEYIEIRRDSVSTTVDISEEVLLEYYEDSKCRYLQDVERQARHILILFDDDEAAAEATATDVLARVQAGESFEALAAEFSKDGGTASNGGDLGTLTRSQLPGDLGGAIYSMQEGAVEGPVKSEFGFHIIRLDQILERGPLPLDQVRGELLTELRDREADDAFRALERRMSDAYFDTSDLQVISAAVGIDVQSASDFTRAGGEPFGSNQVAIDAVFSDAVLNGGEISEIVELDANSVAIFKVAQYREASRQPMAEVSDLIVAEIRAQEADRINIARVEQLLAALDAGEDFGAAAEAANATVENPKLIGRQDQDVDQAVLFQVFTANKPEQNAPVIGQISNVGGGYTVFSLDAVLPGRPESIPLADRDAGKLQLAQQAGGADFVSFVQALYDNADIIINDDAVSGTTDLFQ
jgi:peptidyl-prolyl cis-trans isomerase D